MSTLREELLKFLYEKDIRYLWKLHDKASLFGLFKKPDKEGGNGGDFSDIPLAV